MGNNVNYVTLVYVHVSRIAKTRPKLNSHFHFKGAKIIFLNLNQYALLKKRKKLAHLFNYLKTITFLLNYTSNTSQDCETTTIFYTKIFGDGRNTLLGIIFFFFEKYPCRHDKLTAFFEKKINLFSCIVICRQTEILLIGLNYYKIFNFPALCFSNLPSIHKISYQN